MVRFLKRLLNTLSGSTDKQSRSGVIEDCEQIARYILSKRHFSAQNRTVKYGAYLPAGDGESSVYRISNISEKEIWDIGRKCVADPSQRTLHARGDTSAAMIVKTGLRVVSETSLHPLHANITSWPSAKDEKKMLAVELANEAVLVLPSD